MGTFWLVLGGCGSAVLAASFPGVGIGWVGVALAFGLTVLTMVYAIGHISGCHLNLAVSIGLWAGKRFAGKDLLPYIIVQVLGAFAAAGVLYFVASGKAGFDLATNGLAGVRAELWVDGLTPGAGQGVWLDAEAGVGAASADPSSDAGLFAWVPIAYVGDGDGLRVCESITAVIDPEDGERVY